MLERIDKSKWTGVAVALWRLAALTLLMCASLPAATGQAKKTVHFLPLKGAMEAKSPAGQPAKDSAARPADETTPVVNPGYSLGSQTVNGTAVPQSIGFTTTSSAESYAPTASLRYGTSYGLGTITCTGTYDAGNADYDQSCSLPITFAPHYPGGHRDALFITDPAEGQIGAAFLYGIGEAPQLMIQPGVTTSFQLPGGPYLYGSTTDDAGTFYVYANSDFYTVKGSVATLAVTSVGRGQNGLSIDGAGNLFDAGSGGSSGYEFSTSGDEGLSAELCHNIAGYTVGPIVYLPYTVCFDRPNAVAAGNLGAYYEADGGGEAEDASGSSTYNPGLIAQSYTPQMPVESPQQIGEQGSWGDAPLPYPYNGGNFSPYTMAVDPYENLFFGSSGGIAIWCGWGGASQNNAGCGNSSGMTLVNTATAYGGMAVDAADTLYVSGAPGVQMFAAANSYASVETAIGVNGGSNGTAVGPDGTVYANSVSTLNIIDRSQGSIDWGSNNGSVGSRQTITVYNGGNGPLTLGTITLLGASGYTLGVAAMSPCSNGSTVAAGATCLIEVTSSPTHTGVLTGAIAITSNTLNQANTVQEVALTGYTSGIYVTPSPSPLDFGFVAPGGTSTMPVTLVNTSAGSNAVGYGSSTVVNGGFTSSNPAFSASIGTCNVSEASGGPFCAINVTFNPSLSQTYTGTITWQEAIPGGPTENMSLAVSGTGTPPVIPFADMEAMTISDAISLVPSTLLTVNETIDLSDGVPVTMPSTILNIGESLHLSDTNDLNGVRSSSATTTVLVSSSNVATAGKTITLTATVAQVDSSTAPANGAVKFYEDGAMFANSAVSNGVAAIASPMLTLGSHTFQAIYEGDGTLTGSMSSVVTVNAVSQTVLLVTAGNASRNFGVADPVFGFTITNTAGGAAPSLTGAPSLTTSATLNSVAGSYPIVPGVGTLAAPAGYAFGFGNGTLTVNGGAVQVITFARLPNLPLSVNKITLTARSTSGLPIVYQVTGPASMNGSTLTISGAGTVTVTATQPGNLTFASATPQSRSFVVTQ